MNGHFYFNNKEYKTHSSQTRACIERELVSNGYEIGHNQLGLYLEGSVIYTKKRNSDESRKIVVLIDNYCTDFIVGRRNIDTWRDEIANRYFMPKENIAFVFIEDRITRVIGYLGKNIVVVNERNGRSINLIIDKCLSDQKKAINDGLLLQMKYHKFEEVNTRSASDIMDSKKCYFVYFFILINLIFGFMSLGDYQRFGVSAYTVNERGEVYRYLTYSLFHSNWMHLLGNMISLFFIGRSYAKKVGNSRFIITYMLGGLFAGILTVYGDAFNHNFTTLTIGASGAICAVLGALIVFAIRNRFAISKGTIFSMLLVAGTTLIGGTNTSITCHAGGLLSGTLIGLAFAILDGSEFDRVVNQHYLYLKQKGIPVTPWRRRNY